MGYDKVYMGLGSLSIVLVLVPSPWHLSAWNSATCYMMMWASIGTLIHMVGSTIWWRNIHIPTSAEATWCDIATKLIIGLSIAIPLSSFSINRRLYNIATIRTITITKEQKRRDVIIDSILCVLCPIIFMAVHYTMQGHRFDVIENIGCWPSTYLTLPAYILVLAPPIFVGCVSLVTCSLSIRAFIKRRQEFNAILRSSSTGLNAPRYFRLMALATAEIIFGLPASIFFMVVGIKNNGVHKWISWADTHADFGRIDKYNKYLLEHGLENAGNVVTVSYQMSRWAFPFIGLLFFAFFGFAAEARKNYSIAFWWVAKWFGVQKPEPKPRATGSGSTGISIFGRRFGRNGRPLPSTAQTGTGSVSVSLPQYSTGSGSTGSSENHLPFEGRRKSGATVASLDTSMLHDLDEKHDDDSLHSPTSPSSSSPRELTPPGLRISLTDLSDVSPHARASSLLETPTSPPPRPSSYSRPPTMMQVTPAVRDTFVIRQELDAAQMV